MVEGPSVLHETAGPCSRRVGFRRSVWVRLPHASATRLPLSAARPRRTALRRGFRRVGTRPTRQAEADVTRTVRIAVGSPPAPSGSGNVYVLVAWLRDAREVRP